MARERFAIVTTLSPPEASPWDVKGRRKHKPFTGHCAAFEGERPCAKHGSFAHRTCGRARFWKRFPVCASISLSFGARTGRALQNGSARSQWQSKCWAIHRRSRGKVCEYHNPFTAEPKKGRRSANPSPTEGSSPMAFHWLRLWLVRSSFAVRALCAHQRQSKCFSNWPRAPQSCRARPVRAPKAKQMLRTRQSASKDAPATGRAEKGL